MSNLKGKAKKPGINKKVLILPGLIWIAGVILFVACVGLTEEENAGTVTAFFLLWGGTVFAWRALHKEVICLEREMPFPLNKLFPWYPLIPDTTELHSRLHSFRDAYGEYFADPFERENSTLQYHATQMMWHTFALQKRRLQKFGITIRFHAERRAYTPEKMAVRENPYFDGKYNVNEVYEEIDAVRYFSRGNRGLLKVRDNEVAHYTMLSAHKVGEGLITCPNCGNPTTRENLIDGCDYCGTKFTVEDLADRVAAFGFRRDYETNDSKWNGTAAKLSGWIFMLTGLPVFYLGFLGTVNNWSRESLPVDILASVGVGVFFGFGFWICGIALFSIGGFFVSLLLTIFGIGPHGWKNKLRRPGEYDLKIRQSREKEISALVRESDSLFSLQGFFSGVQNKLSAIHFAETNTQVNAFSDCDLSAFLQSYAQVIEADTESMSLDAYEVQDGVRHGKVKARLRLREYINGKLKTRTETVQMELEKSAECKTQAVCAASVLTCKGCGSSLSLMEGKTCHYCGRELDLKRYDWVITSYRIIANI